MNEILKRIPEEAYTKWDGFAIGGLLVYGLSCKAVETIQMKMVMDNGYDFSVNKISVSKKH